MRDSEETVHSTFFGVPHDVCHREMASDSVVSVGICEQGGPLDCGSAGFRHVYVNQPIFSRDHVESVRAVKVCETNRKRVATFDRFGVGIGNHEEVSTVFLIRASNPCPEVQVTITRNSKNEQHGQGQHQTESRATFDNERHGCKIVHLEKANYPLAVW